MKVFFLNVLKAFQCRLSKARLGNELDLVADENHRSSFVVKCSAQGYGYGGRNRIIPPLHLADCPGHRHQSWNPSPSGWWSGLPARMTSQRGRGAMGCLAAALLMFSNGSSVFANGGMGLAVSWILYFSECVCLLAYTVVCIDLLVLDIGGYIRGT